MHVPASIRFLLLVLALTVAPGQTLAVAPPTVDLASPARGVLERHCLRCHDGPGRAKGGLSHITNLQHLVERGLVVPGKPLSSLLYQRVHEKEMPPPAKRGCRSWHCGARPGCRPMAIAGPRLTTFAPPWQRSAKNPAVSLSRSAATSLRRSPAHRSTTI